MAGRVGKRLIAILRWAPIASYVLAHVIVVGFWALMISDYQLDPTPAAFDPDRLVAFLATVSQTVIQTVMLGAMLYGLDPTPEYYGGLLVAFLTTAIRTVPLSAVLGAVDALARRSSHPLVQVLLLVLEALLIVLFALVWIAPVQALALFREECDEYTCEMLTPDWPTSIGALTGAELGLVLLVVVSVTVRAILRRVGS
jgi:hypothetical protein